MPKVSILMSTYNNAVYLTRAINSVLNQSFSDFEFIIINDNSSDNTEEIIKSFNDQRIVYLKNEENKGLVFSLNKGLEIAQGELIARIDSDDWWIDEDKLKKQVEFLEKNSEYALVGTWAKVYDKTGNELYGIVHPTEFKKIKEKMLIKNCFVHSSVMFRKLSAFVCGNYNDQEKYVEDCGLWLRMGEKYRLANVPDYSVGYLLNKTGETQKNNLRQIKGVLNLIKKYKKSYPNYCLAKMRWYFKFVIVFFGGLNLINKWKSV